MLYLSNITNAGQQQMTLTGIPGINITMTLRFMPRTGLWIAGFDDGATSIQGISVVNNMNILRQWRDNISYGIACIRADGLDPYQIDDFQNKVANLYLLDSADVAQIEADWFA